MTGINLTMPHRAGSPVTEPKRDWDTGRAMWEAGRTSREIATALGCGQDAVRKAKRRYGWPAQPQEHKRSSPQHRPRIAAEQASAVTVRCAWCACRYPLETPDAPRVCPHGHREAA